MSDTICTNPTLQSPLNRASKDKFIMVLNLPYILRNQAKDDPLLSIEPIQISIYGTVVPTITVPAVELDHLGQSLHVSSHHRPTYSPLTVNFVVDNSYQNYYVFWKWLASMNDPIRSTYSGVPEQSKTIFDQMNSGFETEYQTTISILALNEYNENIIEFKYTNAFLTSLGAINYSYRDGELLESTAEFYFNQLNIETSSKKLPNI